MHQPKECQVCEGEIGKHTCGLCGFLVGDKCFNARLGLCKSCARGKQAL